MKEKIAIIGLGCVFPDAPDFTEYWRNIIEGKDSVRDLSGEFWDASDFYDPDPKAQDKFYTTAGAIVDPIEFDSMEFGISPKVMQSTSTEQLFSLIAARQALIDAGLYGKNAKPFNREKTGVIISSPTGKNAFELSHRSEAPKIRKILVNNGIPEDVADRVVEKYKATLSDWTEDNNPGYIPNGVAGRIANRFDLGGTSCSVDAACASSLASLKFAIDELQNGNCDLMLAGGASLDASVTAFVSFCKTPAISKKGKITPFDANADGMILGDGVGIVVLKRLSDAKRDGDKIYAVVRGVGTSGDGRAKSIYAPSKEGQIRALRRAYENAEVEPETIGLIEAHGTGTAAGDACEISAISEVYHKDSGSRDTIIGSVKSQIGHLRMSAGVAGFIKVALALHEKTLPASINMNTPNPVLVDSNLCVLSKPKAWITNDSRPVRRAAVSSFGFGGTNYHIVMEEADADHNDAYRLTPSPMGVMLSGKTKEELVQAVKTLAQGLEKNSRLWYRDEYRYHKYTEGSMRLAFVAKTAAEVKEKCEKALKLLEKDLGKSWVQSEIAYSEKPIDKDAKAAVLFSGQGTQELDMLSEMAIGYPEMREAITKADNVMLAENGTPVSKLVSPNCLTDEERKTAEETLKQTANTQPVLAAMEAGLYIPVADDITVEADSGGHTDGRPLVSILPALMALANRVQKQYSYPKKVRVGAGGGIGTGLSYLGAFQLGAAYVVTGSVNQACVEAGTSDYVKKVLSETAMADVTMAPCADMFESGTKVEVIKKGTMYPQNAQKLYEYYTKYPSFDSIPPAERERIEKRILKDTFTNIWNGTKEYFAKVDPSKIVKAENDPKQKMALVFRWYLGRSSRWAVMGEASRQLDMQIWCGQSMGAFNLWVNGTRFENPANRKVADIANLLLQSCAYHYMKSMLDMMGVDTAEWKNDLI